MQTVQCIMRTVLTRSKVDCRCYSIAHTSGEYLGREQEGRGDWIKLLNSGQFGEMKVSRNLGCCKLIAFNIFSICVLECFEECIRNPNDKKIYRIKTVLARFFCTLCIFKGRNEMFVLFCRSLKMQLFWI